MTGPLDGDIDKDTEYIVLICIEIAGLVSAKVPRLTGFGDEKEDLTDAQSIICAAKQTES